MTYQILGRKQKEDNETFLYVWQNIRSLISKDEIDNLVDRTLEEIRAVITGKQVGFGWSGGKDSVALEFLCAQIGVRACCLGMTHDLEYPAFLRFVTENMPEDLVVINTGQTLEWLAAHPTMLFPQDSKTAAKWFSIIQHKAQVEFYRKRSLDMLLTGRRKLDSNFVGKEGNLYYNRGQRVWRYSPLADWTHEEILALMSYYDLPVAPFYGWKNGWVVGSGNWAARQWTGSYSNGWREIYDIDSSIVEKAADFIPSAGDFLQGALP